MIWAIVNIYRHRRVRLVMYITIGWMSNYGCHYNYEAANMMLMLNTHKDFKLCRPMNILLWISVILFSDMRRSWTLDAPSKAFCSMPVIRFRRKSNLTKCGKRPNRPSDLIRVNSLSLSNLYLYMHIIRFSSSIELCLTSNLQFGCV